MMSRGSAIAAIAICTALFLPALAFGQQAISQGCHAASAAEQQAMRDRGIPVKYEVCPGDTQYLGIGQDFDQWYARIKALPPCNKTTCTLSCRTKNTGAQRCGPTATRWNSIGCHPHNQTAIFPTVSHGFAAHIELLRRYCSQRGRCTIHSAIMQWAPPNVHNNSTGPYIAFVSRAAGIPSNQVYNPNDIDLMARLAMAMSCYEAGSLPYSAAELKQGMQMAGGGARVPVPANVGQLLNESLAGSYASNPSYSPSSYPGSWPYQQSELSSGRYVPQPPPPAPLPLQPYGSPTPQGIGPSGPASSSGTVGSAAVMLMAQPSRVELGYPVLLTWTSVGMRQCEIKQDSAPLVSATQGTRIIRTTTLLRGTHTFSIACTAQNGQQISRTADVILY